MGFTGGLVFIYLTLSVSHASLVSDHECNRRCVVGEPPKTCVYNFTVEWYRTLSKACYDCPLNLTDCYRPHCVAADGHARAILAVNRQMPGPSIEVCEDDTVVVYVKNLLDDGGTITIHWHGIHQYMTPYMDGASHVTQCGIDVKETFRYEFKAKPAGTHWYHSHVGSQIADGLLGAFIVRVPIETDPAALLYESDLSEHIMMVTDWLPETSISRYVSLMHLRFDTSWPVSGLVNGRASKFQVRHPSGSLAKTPMEVFNVAPNSTYRFRLIGGSAACPLKLAIDNHELIVIATDGMPIQPNTVSTLIIQPGERYDFVLSTYNAVDNYVIRFWGLSDCLSAKDNVFALLRYEGANDTYPEIDESVQRSGSFLNPILIHDNNPIYTANELNVMVDDLRSERYNRVENHTEEQVDLVYYIASDFNNNDNQIYNHPLYYPVKSLPPINAHFTPVLDNITFDLPPVPLLSQPEDINPDWFCNRSSLDMELCEADLCICTHMISLKLNQVVDIIFVNEGKTFREVGHPMHLHGHSFRVLGMEQLGEAVSVSDVQNLEKQGRLKRNLVNPPWKDTIYIPDGGYVIVRLIADNPGYWFLHCHVDSHLLQGMAMLIKVGEDRDIPPVPAQFPRCGGMGFSNARKQTRPNPREKDCPSAAGIYTIRPYLITFLLCMVVYYRTTK